MSKPMVEKYEQILSQDPASTVFVELAKALIERGEHARAIEVCKGGLEYHQDSVVGRVLWGKALINLGKPAEAMKQFDQAISIDEDNPHAYNLIGEVLLHKGLYRSALPLLKKAVSLQPNDGRVRQWLEQTQKALAGGPAPILRQEESEANPLAPTEIALQAYAPEQLAAESPPAPPPEASEPDPDPTPILSQPNPKHLEPTPSDPFDVMAARSEPKSGETVRGLTHAFDALSEDVPPMGLPPPGGGAPVLADVAPPVEDVVPTAESTAPSSEFEVPSGVFPRPGGGGLLDDIPEPEDEPAPPPASPQITTGNTEAIAQEYERELRASLAAQRAKKGTLQRHGFKFAVATVLGAAAVAGAIFYGHTLATNRGLGLRDAIVQARRNIAEDTEAGYVAAVNTLEHAAQMDDLEPEVWALLAYAQALRYAEHDGGELAKTQALAALARPRVKEEHPELALVADYLLASGAQKTAARNALLTSTLDRTEVHEAVGRILFSRKKIEDGRKRLSRALELFPQNMRALVPLADYYRQFGDHENALKLYGDYAARFSPRHPERVVGAAESRLALGRELDVSLSEVQALGSTPGPGKAWEGRRVLALGRLLAATGKPAEAVQVLKAGLAAHKPQAYEFHLALGDAHLAGGEMAAAQKAYETALSLRGSDEEARESLGRVLLARGRERELLARIGADERARKVSLVRGIAYSRLKDWKRARAELARTQFEGKFPAEAVVHLALADAAEGQLERAQGVLEKAAQAAKRSQAPIRVALGGLYLQRGEKAKAREQFEQAAEEPSDYEGAFALGQLLLEEGKFEDAVGAFEKAVARNGSFSEAREALVRGLLAVGRWDDAVRHGEAGQEDAPGSASMQKVYALALGMAGRFKDADAPSARAVRLAPKDAEAHRLRAQVLFGKGDLDRAFSSLERANALDPKDPQTFCEIGLAMLRRGDGSTAGKAFEAAQRENPQSLCGQVGAWYAKLPAGARTAVKELNQLAQKAARKPDLAFVKAVLARAHLAAGNAQEAKAAAEEAVALWPASGLGHLSLGLAALKLKQTEAAQAALRRSLDLEPSHGGAWLAMGDLLARGDETEQTSAVTAYETFLKIGGPTGDVNRVKRVLPNLQKQSGRR